MDWIYGFLLMPQFPIKTPGRIFWNLFPPRRKGWRKIWFGLLKFNQKISRWPWTIFKLFYFRMNCFFKCDGFTVLWIISSNSVELCNHGNLTLKLYAKHQKNSYLNEGSFFMRRNFSLVPRYSLKFTRCSLLVVKSLVDRCKICLLLVAKNHSLLVAEITSNEQILQRVKSNFLQRATSGTSNKWYFATRNFCNE